MEMENMLSKKFPPHFFFCLFAVDPFLFFLSSIPKFMSISIGACHLSCFEMPQTYLHFFLSSSCPFFHNRYEPINFLAAVLFMMLCVMMPQAISSDENSSNEERKQTASHLRLFLYKASKGAQLQISKPIYVELFLLHEAFANLYFVVVEYAMNVCV